MTGAVSGRTLRASDRSPRTVALLAIPTIRKAVPATSGKARPYGLSHCPKVELLEAVAKLGRTYSVLMAPPRGAIVGLMNIGSRRVVAVLAVAVAVVVAISFDGFDRVWVPGVLMALAVVLVLPLDRLAPGGWDEGAGEFRIRGVLFSALTYWLVGGLWGASTLSISALEIALSGPLNSAGVRREELASVCTGRFLFRGNCLVFRGVPGRLTLYFSLTSTDYPRVVEALVGLGWPMSADAG
jgi:hypothetical protein